MSHGRAGLDRPLRIVQAAAFPFPTSQGSQVFVRGMARALGRRGHEVTVVCYGHGQGEVDSEYSVVRTPRVPGYSNLRAGPDIVKPFLNLALAQRIAGIPADIVHAHNYEAPIAAALVKRFTGTPLVYSAHNTMVEELPTYFSQPLTKRLAGRLGQWLDRKVPALSDHAVALSSGTAQALVELGCERVSTVLPGVDIGELEGVVPANLPAGPWVVYAGNPDQYQDLHILVEAMHKIPEAGLLLVSASPLEEFMDCGLPRVKCVQTTDFELVKSLISASVVAALPRTVCSGYPIKLLNYLGLGIPTVAAEGSARNLPGVIAVPNGDADAMAHEIRTLIGDKERCSVLGARAREHVRTACTWDSRARELESVYADVLTSLD
jgi:glycosyltransferase involved in cell wall biosynthesis